ncbi:hypothetical protein D9613_001717 [Agrocybe pediades]|uniref:Uncharacterized protein n=1 Tax=Agrocybe pediades TaxID=84607 RepID=A0A8H4R864_9AGAR|nr:hypothetical protein D9613_001717 [Agrocybe pediades]
MGRPTRHRGDATLLPSVDLEPLGSEEGLSSLDFEMSSEEATRLYDSELDMEILRSLSSSPTLVGSPRASSPDSKAAIYKGYTVSLEGMDVASKLRSCIEADPFGHDAWDAQLQHIFEQYINIEECCDT